MLEVSQSGTHSGSGSQQKQFNKPTVRVTETRNRNPTYKSTSLPSNTTVTPNAANKSADCYDDDDIYI